MTVRLHKFIPVSKVDGPGERACLFAQGCPVRCDGCAVPWTWDPAGGEEFDTEIIINAIRKGPKVDGVTFLGGEPFAQAAPLAEIARELKKDGLSVVAFTGYQIERLRSDGDAAQLSLLDATDLLIDGPFIKELAATNRPWVGSANQRYHFLTGRLAHVKEQLRDIPNKLEFRILPNGMVSVNGLVATDDLKKYVESLIN